MALVARYTLLIFLVVIRNRMKTGKLVLGLVVVLVFCAAVSSGCKRRPQNYAGLPDPQKGEVIDPHKSY